MASSEVVRPATLASTLPVFVQALGLPGLRRNLVLLRHLSARPLKSCLSACKTLGQLLGFAQSLYKGVPCGSLLHEVPSQEGDQKPTAYHDEERSACDSGYVPCLRDQGVQDWEGIGFYA